MRREGVLVGFTDVGGWAGESMDWQTWGLGEEGGFLDAGSEGRRGAVGLPMWGQNESLGRE